MTAFEDRDPGDEQERAMTVGEDFPREQARCRKLLEEYRRFGNTPGISVSPTVAMDFANIKAVLQRADQAMASGDVVEILRSYEEMRGCE